MNEMDLQSNRIHLKRGKLCFFLEGLLNNHEKNNNIFVLVLAELTTKILKRKDRGMKRRKANKAMNEVQ